MRGAGVELVLVTARPARRVQAISEALALHDGQVICANGAVIYDLAANTIVKQTALAAGAARELIEQLRAALPEICFAVETGLAIGREPAFVRHRPTAAAAAGEIADALELAARGAVKLIAMHPSLALEDFWTQARAIVAERASVTHTGAAFLEIAAAEVSKAWALAAHCESLAISRDDVLAFGDMPNDLPMLQWAGRAIAVANAHPSVLAAAHEHTASNDDDGVAAYLEPLFGV